VLSRVGGFTFPMPVDTPTRFEGLHLRLIVRTFVRLKTGQHKGFDESFWHVRVLRSSAASIDGPSLQDFPAEPSHPPMRPAPHYSRRTATRSFDVAARGMTGDMARASLGKEYAPKLDMLFHADRGRRFFLSPAFSLHRDQPGRAWLGLPSEPVKEFLDHRAPNSKDNHGPGRRSRRHSGPAAQHPREAARLPNCRRLPPRGHEPQGPSEHAPVVTPTLPPWMPPPLSRCITKSPKGSKPPSSRRCCKKAISSDPKHIWLGISTSPFPLSVEHSKFLPQRASSSENMDSGPLSPVQSTPAPSALSAMLNPTRASQGALSCPSKRPPLVPLSENAFS
jgi:hypothetical protein